MGHNVFKGTCVKCGFHFQSFAETRNVLLERCPLTDIKPPTTFLEEFSRDLPKLGRYGFS